MSIVRKIKDLGGFGMPDKQKIKEIQKVIDKFNDNDALPCEQWILEIEMILNSK